MKCHLLVIVTVLGWVNFSPLLLDDIETGYNKDVLTHEIKRISKEIFLGRFYKLARPEQKIFELSVFVSRQIA